MWLISFSITHFEALVCGEELGHGAEGNGIGAVLLQRRRCFAYDEARSNQLGSHFCQLELQKLPCEESQRRTDHLASVAGLIFWFADLSLSKVRMQGGLLTWLFESGSPNCLRTNRWSLACCTDACAAPREQEAGGREFRGGSGEWFACCAFNKWVSCCYRSWPSASFTALVC